MNAKIEINVIFKPVLEFMVSIVFSFLVVSKNDLMIYGVNSFLFPCSIQKRS